MSGFETEPVAIGIGWPSSASASAAVSSSPQWEYLAQFGEGSTTYARLVGVPRIDSHRVHFVVKYTLPESAAVRGKRERREREGERERDQEREKKTKKKIREEFFKSLKRVTKKGKTESLLFLFLLKRFAK